MALDYQPLFILSGGMLLQERKLAVTTNNLANINTPSFKKDLLEIGAWYADNGEQIQNPSPENPTNNYVYPMITNVHTDLSQGPLRQTGNPLDFAIEGDGFFAVRTPEGIRYTRKGMFRLDAEGFLVTEEGYRVLDDQEREIRIRGNDIKVDPQGNIYVDGQRIATFGIWVLPDAQKEGLDYFSGTPQQAENFRIFQGFIEDSNVNGIMEMVNIINASRAHEVYARLIQSLDEIQGRVNNIIR